MPNIRARFPFTLELEITATATELEADPSVGFPGGLEDFDIVGVEYSVMIPAQFRKPGMPRYTDHPLEMNETLKNLLLQEFAEQLAYDLVHHAAQEKA